MNEFKENEFKEIEKPIKRESLNLENDSNLESSLDQNRFNAKFPFMYDFVNKRIILIPSIKNYSFYLKTISGTPVFIVNIDGGNIGIGTVTPNANSVLDLTSTTKAFLPPRMTTTQRDAIPSPVEGMVIYNLTTHVLNFHNGTAWGAV